MERSQLCNSCGLTSQRCQCRRRQVPTTGKAVEITPAYLCSCYLYTVFIVFSIALLFLGFIALGIKADGKDSCHLELFADSINANANANANISAADWRIHFSTTSPVTGCRISLNTISARLLRGNEVISNSSPDYFGRSFREYQPVTTVDFKAVATTPDVIGGVVVWDFRVEIVAGVKTDARFNRGSGFLMVVCSDLPVKFTADPAGNVMGSLLGNMRRCDYSFRKSLDPFP